MDNTKASVAEKNFRRFKRCTRADNPIMRYRNMFGITREDICNYGVPQHTTRAAEGHDLTLVHDDVLGRAKHAPIPIGNVYIPPGLTVRSILHYTTHLMDYVIRDTIEQDHWPFSPLDLAKDYVTWLYLRNNAICNIWSHKDNWSDEKVVFSELIEMQDACQESCFLNVNSILEDEHQDFWAHCMMQHESE